MLPSVESMVSYSDQLVLYDNLNTPLLSTLTSEIESFIGDLPKRIDFAIILLCVKGRIEIDCNLRNLVAGPKGLLVLVPGTIAERIYIDPDSTLIVLSVPDQNYAPESSFQNATYVQRNFTSPIAIELDDEVFHSGIESYKQLKNAIVTMGDKMSDDLVKAYIMVMAGLAAVNLQKWMIAHPQGAKPSKEQVLKQFLTNVEEYHREHRDVSFYADKAGLSPKYFAKIIHASSMKHPLDWIKSYVILDAKSMLKSGEFSIGDICEALHFASRAQFNRYFKDSVGLSPMEYAKSGKS